MLITSSLCVNKSVWIRFSDAIYYNLNDVIIWSHINDVLAKGFNWNACLIKGIFPRDVWLKVNRMAWDRIGGEIQYFFFFAYLSHCKPVCTSTALRQYLSQEELSPCNSGVQKGGRIKTRKRPLFVLIIVGFQTPLKHWHTFKCLLDSKSIFWNVALNFAG